MFAKYADCDPLATNIVSRIDQMLPYFIMDVAGNIPGLPGLFIAGVFCAALRYNDVNISPVSIQQYSWIHTI